MTDSPSQPLPQSTLLQGGRIIDGSGGPSWEGDLLIVGDRIQRMGVGLEAELQTSEVRVVDCRGWVIAPGFIDAHTHDDALVLRDPACRPKISQGVTTVVTGNCGISLAPYQTPAAAPPLNLLGSDSFRHARFVDYAQALQAAQPAVNVVPLIGHTTLRFAVLEDLRRAATASQRQEMARLLDDCMAHGAFGLSSGLFYEEAYAAPADEVTDLARVVSRHGGVYATHLRSEMQTILEAMHEAADCAFDAGVPLILSHHKCAGPAQWGRTRETLPLIDRLAVRQEVAMDAYPYVAGSTVLREDLVDGVIDVLVTWSDPYPEFTGHTLADIAAQWGVDQKAACRRLMPGGACYFQMREDDVERVLAHPRTMIGSDGLPHDRHPHPRLWGAFPRVLARYWREKGLFSLEEAVHRMTGLTARNFRIPERGLLRVGHWADVVVFDPDLIADTSTYDRPISPCVGIHAVFVNGVRADAHSDSSATTAPSPPRAGRLLKRRA
ncbi:MAG: hypothetical protein RI949_1435 [Pseudomonadota bacterium]|jgi:N-acyl-D-amino-acid deacylase